MNFERLKYVRENLELSQADVSKELNVGRSTYTGWEVGIDSIPLSRLNSICNLFSINIDYITYLTNTKVKILSNKDIDLKELGKRMKSIRLKAGDSQEYVATIIGTTQSTYSKYERGENTILTAFIIEFAKHYNTSIDWLCDRTN